MRLHTIFCFVNLDEVDGVSDHEATSLPATTNNIVKERAGCAGGILSNLDLPVVLVKVDHNVLDCALVSADMNPLVDSRNLNVDSHLLTASPGKATRHLDSRDTESTSLLNRLHIALLLLLLLLALRLFARLSMHLLDMHTRLKPISTRHNRIEHEHDKCCSLLTRLVLQREPPAGVGVVLVLGSVETTESQLSPIRQSNGLHALPEPGEGSSGARTRQHNRAPGVVVITKVGKNEVIDTHHLVTIIVIVPTELSTVTLVVNTDVATLTGRGLSRRGRGRDTSSNSRCIRGVHRLRRCLYRGQCRSSRHCSRARGRQGSCHWSDSPLHLGVNCHILTITYSCRHSLGRLKSSLNRGHRGDHRRGNRSVLSCGGSSHINWVRT